MPKPYAPERAEVTLRSRHSERLAVLRALCLQNVDSRRAK